MYKHLYDNFKHWFHGGQVYFYSDPHFADEEMKYLRKDYIGDEEQVKRINSKIGKNDTLVILGDIGNINWIKKIRGYKVLIQGNHDSGASNYRKKYYSVAYDATTKKRLGIVDITDVAHPKREVAKKAVESESSTFINQESNGLFDEVYEGCLMISDKIILSHEPVDFKYALNIHGHDHSMWSKNDKCHLNVCAEHIDYMPVSFKEIIESGYLKNIPNVHRETIDKATNKALKRTAAE